MNVQKAPGTHSSSEARQTSGVQTLRLPFLARITELVAERGFGFVTCGSMPEGLFFHVAANSMGRRDFIDVDVEDLVLCQIGTRPKEPGRRCVVQWARVADLDWLGQPLPKSQADLDVYRSRLFEERSLKQLHQQMDAQWYVKQWGGNAPADLQDRILGKAWVNRIAPLDAGALRSAMVREHLQSSRFDFTETVNPASPHCSVENMLARFSPEQMAVLGPPERTWFYAPKPAQQDSFLADVARRVTAKEEDRKSDILEWALLYHIENGSEDRLRDWLSADSADEAVAAQRLLDRGIPLPAVIWQWVMALAEKGLMAQAYVDRLVDHDPTAAAMLFEQLSDAVRHRVQSDWEREPERLLQALERQPGLQGKVARSRALAIDLETDGDHIWEIGCSGAGVSVRLHDEAKRTDIEVALTELGVCIDASAVVVGHNILAWDWPLLAPRMSLKTEPLIWDTLLVQYLLEPQATSHALGGSHHAEADAEANLELFVRQLDRLPGDLSTKLFSRQFGGTMALLRAIIDAVPQATSLARPCPDILRDEGRDPARLLLLPEHELRDFDWVSGVAVVQADLREPLQRPFWQIDAEYLGSELAAGQDGNPFAAVLLAVCQRAAAEGVALRYNMLPAWLLDRKRGLMEAVERSCFVPAQGGRNCIAPFPRSSEGWAALETLELRAALADGQALVVDRGAPIVDVDIPTGQQERAALIRIAEPHCDKWLFRDRAAQILDVSGGWQSFRTVLVADAIARVERSDCAAKTRPVLATRQHATHFPGSRDQAGYWTGVLEAFRAYARADAVPVLLVTSTASVALLDMLKTALSEVGLGEEKTSYRSRRDHLLRAASRGLAIVDTVDHWRDWQALARDNDVSLQPVVDALPLEEWFALAETAMADGDADASGTVTPSSETAVAVSDGIILERAPELIGKFIGAWLQQCGLDSSERHTVILDARASSVSHQLRAFMEFSPLNGAPWSAEETERLQLVFEPLRIRREEAPSDFATMERFLVRNWQPADKSRGDSIVGFKQTQALAMEAIRTRANDVIVSLPTGEGKSVLFQVPALCRGLRNRRLTLVLSPLKALMRDQVARLHEQGFADSVDYLSSDRASFELADVLQGVLDNRIVLLYVAPERLRNAAFIDVLRRRIGADGGLEYVVFDEAHCINQWGYEFRPDYFYSFSYLMSSLRGGGLQDVTPFLLLSATLTASDKNNIGDLLANLSHGNAGLPLSICANPETSAGPLRSHIEIEPVRARGNLLDKRGFDQALTERLPHILDVIRKARANRAETGQRSAVIIFVTRRAHADDLAGRLTEASGCDVESFHAGLDAATRDDIYSRFRDGDLDILVATKAFGMGMDIPDIHWVVHLSPPAYIEDYLQEVGRIGRGVAERERAGLGQLNAGMFFSPSDFETMRSLRAVNELSDKMIDATETNILRVAETIEGQRVAFVPHTGFGSYTSAAQMRAKATSLRMALFWLEKAGHLVQLGSVADLISVELFPARLSELAEEQSSCGVVAKAILSIAAAPAGDFSRAANAAGEGGKGGVIGGFVNWLSDLIGLKLDKPASPPQGRRLGADETAAVINISQIRSQCRLKSADETMAVLADLQRRGCLKMRWALDFAKRPLLSEPERQIDGLISSVGNAVRRIVKHLELNGRVEFNPLDHLDSEEWAIPDLDEDEARSEKKRAEREALLRRYQRAYLQGFRTLARASGIRMKQQVRPNEEAVFWVASTPPSRQGKVRARCNDLLSMVPSLLAVFKAASEKDIEDVAVQSLIAKIEAAHPRKTFRIADLEALLRLFSALNLVSAQPELIPLSYVLRLTGAQKGFGQHQKLVEELNDVNAFAEARSFAMEVFANLPQPVRGDFIGPYFAQANGTALKAFLETQLGEIEGEDNEVAAFIAAKRDQLRATRATEFFERYRHSQEPAQWQAISHPFNRHLLVNAGPGAGKTSVLVARITHLIREQRIKPSEIIVLAFNRAVVFEIRKRIRELFKALGYAAYASQVRVFTFHALARRSMADAGDESAAFDNLLSRFAEKLQADASFRKSVAGGCRSILVDEFQDVTDDVYSIIRNLRLGSGEQAGVMVIGDDDQDILRWQRKAGTRENGAFAEIYFQRFRGDFGGDELRTLELCVNFRSGSDIVAMSQKMITAFFERNAQSSRLKTTLLRQADTAGTGCCERIDARGWDWERTGRAVVDACMRLRAQNPGTLAVLCRTNDEVAEIHRHLAPHFPAISVQSSENMRIADLRHVALWCDFLEAEIAKDDRALTASLLEELSRSFLDRQEIPETDHAGAGQVGLGVLWELCCEESVFPHLSTLLRFIKGLQRDELQRLLGQRQGDNEVVLSTIHKVKGLEFQNVVIAPSRSSFGIQSWSDSVREGDAAGEARLLYVALTRAKTRLVYFVGDREFAWGSAPPRAIAGVDGEGRVLTGAHNQVDLGWAMRRSRFNTDPDECQTYIERSIRVGDQLSLAGIGSRSNMTLIHCDGSGARRQIGCIASKVGAGNHTSELTVSAVVRYPADERRSDIAGNLVAARGWGYAVLVAGRLR